MEASGYGSVGMVSWGMEMVALGWNCIIKHGDGNMGVKVSGLQHKDSVEIRDAMFCHYSIHGTIPVPPLQRSILPTIVQCYYLCVMYLLLFLPCHFERFFCHLFIAILTALLKDK